MSRLSGQVYQLKIKGYLDSYRSNWFEDMQITNEAENTITVLTGCIVDQTALHGLLNRVRDLGLTLLSLNLFEENNDEFVNSTKGEISER